MIDGAWLAQRVACSGRLAAARPDLQRQVFAMLAAGPQRGHGCAPRRRALLLAVVEQPCVGEAARQPGQASSADARVVSPDG